MNSSSAQLQIFLDKHFAFANDILHVTLKSDDQNLTAASSLVLRNSEGSVIKTIAGSFNQGISRFSFDVPAEIQEGWYDLSGFSYDKDLSVLDIVQVELPIYELSKTNAEFTSFRAQIVSSDITKCESDVIEQQAFIISTLAYLINQKIELQTSSKRMREGDAVAQTPLYMRIDYKKNEQVYFGFFRPRVSQIQGLRKVNDNLFKIDVKDILTPVEGQVLGTDAFGVIKKYDAEYVPLKFELPEILASDNPLPQHPELKEYSSRLRKSLVIQNLYGQYVFYPQVSSLFSPSEEYEKNDFVAFNDTEEFLDEVIPLVRYRAKKRTVEVMDSDKKWLRGEALVFVDDQILQKKEVNKNVDYDVLRKVTLYRNKNILREAFGAFGRNGVVIFETEELSQKQPVIYNPGNTLDVRYEPNDGPYFINGGFVDKVELQKVTNSDVILTSYKNGRSCLIKKEKAD